MSENGYEFTEHQNSVIKKLVNQMFLVGIFVLVMGAISVAWGASFLIKTEPDVIYAIFAFVLAVIFIVIGIITLRSAGSFRKVITTEGNDIENLMSAIDKLTTWFSIMTMMIVIFIAIMVLGFIAKL